MPPFLIVGLDDDEEPELSKDGLIAHFQRWDESGRSTSVTEYKIAGLFYLRYRERFKLDSPSNVLTDIEHFRKFLRMCKDAPELAPDCVEVFFTPAMKHFKGLQPRALSNPKVISGWNIFELASKIRHVTGEQSEFKKSKSYGVKYL